MISSVKCIKITNLVSRFCEQVWHGEPTRYKAEMRAHREQAHREENVAVKECFVLQCKGCPTNFVFQDSFINSYFLLQITKDFDTIHYCFKDH